MSPRLEIRRVGADDSTLITDLELAAELRRAWTAELGEPAADVDFAADFSEWWADEHERRTLWLAQVDGLVVGMINVLEFRRMPRPGRPAGRWGYVSNMFVLAGRRNAGIGRALLDTAITEARRRGYVRLLLAPSEKAVPLYGRVGFRAADELRVLPLTPAECGVVPTAWQPQ